MTRLNSAYFLWTASVFMALSGCQQAEAPAPADSETMAPLPDAKPGVTGVEARLILPAVEGRPGVAYFELHNRSADTVDIAAVHIDGVARAEMHNTVGGSMKPVDTVPVDPGKDIAFAPGGLHVMAFEIDPALVAGGASEMTLTFAGGDKLSMPVKIEAMGSGMQGMAGMDHGGDQESAH